MSVANYLKTSKVPDPQSFWEYGKGLPGRRRPKRPKTAPPGFDHGSTSTNVEQAPVPNPGSSTADQEPYYPLMPAPMQGSWEGCFELCGVGDDVFSNKADDEVHGMPHAFAPAEDHPDLDMGWEHALQPDKGSWKDPDFNWDHLTNSEQHPELPGLAPAEPPKYGDQVEHWQQPSPGPDTDFDWGLWSNLDDQISDKQSLPKVTGQAHENVEDASVPQPKPRSSTEPWC